MTKHTQIAQLGAAVLFTLAACAAQAQTDVNVSIEGIIKPGVYGRVEIGTRPPPPVVYPQPVIITAPVVVQQAPIYMHVPPGHAKNWAKHCSKYNACNQSVYFVQVNEENYARSGDNEDEDRKGHGKGKDKGSKHGRGHGKHGGNDD
jgi:hypothetical protein